MNVYEMEGFLRGKCLPGDLKVNESNAEYLVRKLNAVSELKGELTAALATIEKCREIVGCPAGVDLQDHLRQLAAENVGLTSGFSFFMHSPDAGFETYKTRDEAINAANEMIDEYRGDAGDGWPEEVEQTVWGVIIQHAVQCDIKKPSEENRWEGSCDYKLLPEPPATSAYLAGIKADATGPLVSALKVIANSEQHNGDTVVCDFDTLISVAACALRDYYAKQLREGASE
ncbi:hypothetical protein [Raoultella ornithinolytica]|uniref:hypothetical protein n=1 Tax=Raoultella ornithinolytica TaxID=54291 RepID=UPI00190D3013|nr:hypothetical protein [Raoultella ornithinolytica]